MNIHICHMTINVIIQPQEPVQEAQPIRRGHRDPVEQLKLELEIKQTDLMHAEKAIKQATRQIHKYKLAERLRVLFGDETANSVLGGII